MDWLEGMNSAVRYIENNLTQPMPYESLARIAGCSVYEFSKIFSFIAGMPVSEYIRRRRLSQAVFDIQNSDDKIIDIALKYCYESPTAFTRVFKELHGIAPLSARKAGVRLKTCPAISFALTIKGAIAMTFRIETKPSFQIMGLSGHDSLEQEGGITPLWNQFMAEYNPKLWNQGTSSFYTKPFYQISAYSCSSQNDKVKAIIGAEYKGAKPEGIDLSIETIPAATWAVFTFHGATGFTKYGETFTRILTEWFPTSQYRRDESIPHLDVYPSGVIDDNYTWEIWIPVLKK